MVGIQPFRAAEAGPRVVWHFLFLSLGISMPWRKGLTDDVDICSVYHVNEKVVNEFCRRNETL
jgi:hypothetical protein